MIDDDWAFTELEEIEPADDEDAESLVAVATFCVIVMASTASLLLLAIPMLIATPGGNPLLPDLRRSRLR